MIEELSTWAEQIIVAVIIAEIIEMILPNGNNKKYVKAVIGVYILFTIISPIIGKITKINLDNINYEKYFNNTYTYETMSESLSSNNDRNIEEIYTNNLKQDIKNKLKEKGFIVENLETKIENKNEENYGKVNEIILYLHKTNINNNEQEQQDVMNNSIQLKEVEKIKIGKNDSEQTNVNEKDIDKEPNNRDINDIKEYLSNVYEIKKKNIKINEY